MITHDLKDKEGRDFAFEIASVGRQRLCRIVSSFPEARLLRTPKFLSWWREEEFCEFEVGGQKFIVWEPFGDNSRYWIGPEPPHWCELMALVREFFRRYT